MSRSNPSNPSPIQRVLPFAPKPTIPVVNITAKPPEGMRWLAIGEKMEAGDMAVSQQPWTAIPDILVGQRLHKPDVGRFARWLVPPAKAGWMARILQKQK